MRITYVDSVRSVINERHLFSEFHAACCIHLCRLGRDTIISSGRFIVGLEVRFNMAEPTVYGFIKAFHGTPLVALVMYISDIS